MFLLYNHHQGAYCTCFAKVIIVKHQSTYNKLPDDCCITETCRSNFYCCTVNYGIYILFSHQQMRFLLNLEKFKFI